MDEETKRYVDQTKEIIQSKTDEKITALVSSIDKLSDNIINQFNRINEKIETEIQIVKLDATQNTTKVICTILGVLAALIAIIKALEIWL